MISKRYRLKFIGIITLYLSCTTLGYDDHSKPIPKQDGYYTSISLEKYNGEVIWLSSIVDPVNYESGWDEDDRVLVFRSPLIKGDEFNGNWSLWSDSWWSKFRLNCNNLFGYGGSVSCRVIEGKLRLYFGTRGQFLVDLNSFYLIYRGSNEI